MNTCINFLLYTILFQNDIIPQILWHMDSGSLDQEDDIIEDMDHASSVAERVEQFKLDITQKVTDAFEELYADAESKPNSFNVKLELIKFARKEFSQDYKRIYDITVIIDTGDLMEGAMRISVQETGISLLAEDDIVLEEVSFMDIQELGEEKYVVCY